MNNCFRFLTALVIIFCSLNDTTTAQDTVLNITYKGKVDSLKSAVLDQTRYIEVFLPSGFKAGSDEKYDVLYVLDGGNWNTGLILRIQQFLESQGYMPPIIIVSVMGIDRNRELTPTAVASLKNSGDGGKFLGFITNELIPHVNKHYPSDGDNTLWGHSLGGMFVVYAMLSEPGAFKSYIAVDPSFWWDDCYIPKMAATKLSTVTGDNSHATPTLFISGREGSSYNDMKIDSMELALKRSAPAALNWKLLPYTGETHNSIRFKSIYDGLRFTYDGLGEDIEFYPANGILEKGKPVKIRYFDDTTRMHYTLDGTSPTTESPAVPRELVVSEPATITYKRLSNRSKYDKSQTGKFIHEKTPAPVMKGKKLQAGGFNYAYFEGDWKQWPDLKNTKPVKTGTITNDFDWGGLPRKDNFAMLISGWLEIKEDGYYMFLFQGDKHSKFYIGDKLLMEWNGSYTRRTDSYMLPLSKGFYPVRIEHLQKNKDFKLAFAYLTPSGAEPVPVPLEVQYGVKENR